MTGETDLGRLLGALEPHLHPEPFIFCSVDEAAYARLGAAPLGMFREAEGITAILSQTAADAAGIAYTERWACITLSVHSALAAVGLIAAVSTALAAAGISTNPVAGFYHDHLFVPWDARERAVAVLGTLAPA